MVEKDLFVTNVECVCQLALKKELSNSILTGNQIKHYLRSSLQTWLKQNVMQRSMK
jgi:hypothetical protein